jgi:hypothetical protein
MRTPLHRRAFGPPAAIAVTLLLHACSGDMPTEPGKAAPPAGADVVIAAVPTNDDIANATVIGTLPFTETISTAEATTEATDPDCVGNGPTVWYRFTPASSLRISANTLGSDYDTSISVYTGTPGDLTQIACNDDAGSLQSAVSFDAEAGETYFIMVGAFGSGPGGNMTITVSEAPPPLEVGVTAAAGAVNAKAGTARLSGTVSCSRPALVEISGTLRQRIGRSFISADFFAFLECDGETAWEAEVIPQNGLLVGGQADVVVGALFFEQATGEFQFAQVETRVRLTGRGK